MRRLIFLAIVVTSSFTFAAEERLPGFESPQRAFEAYLTGAANENYDLMLSALTRESKAYHLSLAVFSAVYLFSDDPAMQKILQDHTVVFPSESNSPNETDEEKLLVDTMLKIKDPGALMKKIEA